MSAHGLRKWAASLSTLSFPRSKSTFSQPEGECIYCRWCSENWYISTFILHLNMLWKNQVLHTAWCNISDLKLQGKFEVDHSRGWKSYQFICSTQAITEASYVNIPVIAFCNTDSPLRHVDVAIPCNNKGVHAVGLMWWMLAREVLRMRGSISRSIAWDVMPDLYFYRDPEEVSTVRRHKHFAIHHFLHWFCNIDFKIVNPVTSKLIITMVVWVLEMVNFDTRIILSNKACTRLLLLFWVSYKK